MDDNIQNTGNPTISFLRDYCIFNNTDMQKIKMHMRQTNDKI